MRQLIKHFSWIALLALGVQSSWAYSLGGPIGNGPDAWQAPIIGYGLGGDLVAPKNLGEEYRRNIPVLYYAYDANFLDYFGSNGTVSADSAFAILNSLTNVDNYSSTLSEFPLETRETKFEAQALGLFDVKSVTLGVMMEQMGLAEPERYVWTLHDRFLPGGGRCPVDEEYLVVQRNYDFTSSPLNQLQYSPYINDTLYTYNIVEFCTGVTPLAQTIPLAVDPLADTFTPVASFEIGYGDFYSGLTRDDVAGLRYQLSTNNINFEAVGTGSLLLTTNIGTPAQETTITTANLNTFLTSALTNTPAQLQALFPGLVVTSSTFTFAPVCAPVVTTFFTNAIGAPAGSPQISVFVTNTVCVSQQIFTDVFGNVITNGNLNSTPNIINSAGIVLNYSPNTAAQLVTVSLSLTGLTGSPSGSPVQTNTTSLPITLSGTPSGEFFLVPAGQCGVQIVPTPGYPIAGPTVFTTNVIATATDTNGFVSSQSIVTSFTPHTFVVEPIFCSSTPNATGLYQGVKDVKFVRADFDSLLGQFFQPVTNTYTMVAVTNSQPVTQFFQRVVTAPDFRLSAADLASGPSAAPVVASFSRNVNFSSIVAPANGLAGPGVINSPTTITFDKVGPVFFNNPADTGHPTLDGTPYFTELPGDDVADLYYSLYFVWAQFDGSTNEPAVFPDGTSVANLENQVLVQITPTSLADGTNGVSYVVSAGTVKFTATGGAFSPPFTWSASGLPAGMTLSSNGTLAGTPLQSGTFDFTVELTDSLSRSVQWNYTIIIH